MDHRLSDEHEALRKSVESFARDVVAPQAEESDRTGEFPYDVVRQMGEMGLFGLPFPEDVGGMGGDFLALCLAIEELARVDSSVAITLEAAVGLGSMPVFRFGSDAQKREWLPVAMQWRGAGCLRADRAGRRFRCRQRAHDGHP